MTPAVPLAGYSMKSIFRDEMGDLRIAMKPSLWTSE
jgi:hypothetical protein